MEAATPPAQNLKGNGQPVPISRLIESDPAAAVERLRRVVARDPRNAPAWRLMGRTLRQLEREDEAGEAEMAAIRATAYDPQMIAIAAAMLEGDLEQAEALLRERLHAQPTDAAAIRLMAELAARIGRLPRAEALLRRACGPGSGERRVGKGGVRTGRSGGVAAH